MAKRVVFPKKPILLTRKWRAEDALRNWENCPFKGGRLNTFRKRAMLELCSQKKQLLQLLEEYILAEYTNPIYLEGLRNALKSNAEKLNKDVFLREDLKEALSLVKEHSKLLNHIEALSEEVYASDACQKYLAIWQGIE